MHTLQYPEALLRNIFNPTGRLDGQSKGCRGGLVTPVMCGTPGNTARNALHPIMSINQPLLRLEENLCLACDNWLHTRQTLVEWCVLAPWDLIFFFDFWHFWGHFFLFFRSQLGTYYLDIIIWRKLSLHLLCLLFSGRASIHLNKDIPVRTIHTFSCSTCP